MADQQTATFATPEAMASKIKKQYPVYAKISDHDLVNKVLAKYPQYWDHVDKPAFESKGFKPADVTPPPPAKPAEPTYAPTWWGRTQKALGIDASWNNIRQNLPHPSWGDAGKVLKGLPGYMGDLVFGGSSPGGAAPTPADKDAQQIVQQVTVDNAAKGDAAAQATLDLEAAASRPRLSVTSTGAFQKVFDPKSQSRTSRFATGFVKAGESLTSLDNLYALGTMAVAPENISKPVGAVFQGQMALGGIQGVSDAHASSASGDKGGSAEAWGNLLGNAAVVVGMHFGSQGYEAFRERDNNAVLNDHAEETYKKKFADLRDDQKAHVLYAALEDANPKFRSRVNAEVERINKTQGRKAAESASDAEVANQDRVQAAQSVVNRILASRARQEVFRQDAAQREAATRRAQYDRDKAADTHPPAGTSLEQQRGFPVEESRITANLPNRGSVLTTEREGQMFNPEPEPAKPAVNVEDRRFWIGDRDLIPARAPEAEKPVQQFAEQRMGESFSSLPLARQQVVARYFSRFNPEQWEAFKGTPAFASFVDRQRVIRDADAALQPFLDRNQYGDRTPLDPNADLHAGLSKLILARTNIEQALKADPATYRDLNEHAEKVMGASFDALNGEGQTAALADYLREKPDKVKAFLTPDLAERIRSGQPVNLANMDALLADRQQAEILMTHRDAVRREMEAGVAQQMVHEERASHERELAQVIQAAPTGETRSFEAVEQAARGLTPLAERLSLRTVSSPADLFRAEDDIRQIPRKDRVPEMEQYLTRMRALRATAEEHVLRELAESTAAQFRADRETARDRSVREVVHLTSQADDLKRVAQHLENGGGEQRAEAEVVRQTATFLDNKANAIVSGAEAAVSPAPERLAVRVEVPLSVGRETRVVYPGNQDGLAAHYAIVDANALQTSHVPFTYEKREGYNQNGQPRDYSINATAQGNVETRAANLDTDILLSNDPQTMGGPPVADQRMHVISGNGRTLSILTALDRKPSEYAKYLEQLHDRAPGFGLNPDDLTKYKNPMLVKVLDSPVTSDIEWARMGREMNVDPSVGMSGEEMGVALARLLTPENTDRLASIIDSLPTYDEEGRAVTVREAMRARSGAIADLLRDTGIISAHKSEEYLTPEGELKGKAKDLFENMLSGLTVNDPAVLKDASPSTKDKLARAGLFFVQMKAAGEDWNLASYNSDAVDLTTRAQHASARLADLVSAKRAQQQGRDGATGGESLVEKYLHPERYLDATASLAFDDQPLHPPVHPAVEALALALEEAPKTYAGLMAKFAREAKDGGVTMFGAEHPADIFTNVIGSQYGIKVIPEDWGRVVGLPDAVKAAIEDSRGPLPVEPSVQAETVEDAVHPDSSSVVDAMKSGPRTVSALRDALASHEGIGPEQAEALTQVFEDILPRAIGEKFEDLLGNRRLSVAVGGKEGKSRGYHEMVEDGKAVIRLCDSADTSTFLHEMAHYIRQYLRPEDQRVAHEFVGAKPGTDWTDAQEEKFAQAFERYHYDGGIRRGKLEAVFAKLARAMQSVYNAVTGRNLAKGTPELNAMFDKWYDWQRSERKPITKRLDVDALEAAAKGTVQIPDGARVVDGRGSPGGMAQNFVFLGKDEARQFVRDSKNGVRAWEMYQAKGDDTVYVRADAKKGKRLHQGATDVITLARQARDLEAQLKRATDPREQARLRGTLNGIEDKLRGSTYVLGGKADPPDTSATQLIYGVSEQPTMAEPTTPAQAETVQAVHGDPTAVSLGGDYGRKGRVSKESAGVREHGQAPGVDESARAADGEHGAAGSVLSGRAEGRERGGADLSKSAVAPLSKVKAASVMAPERPRGTPVVDPDTWRAQAEALGLPEGTPPPTVRLDPAIRQMAIYPGQAEAIEGGLSALQQHDATIFAWPTGSGKTFGLSAIANHLLGTDGDKVGLIVTRSQNLIHEADGYMEWGRKVGVTVDALPAKTDEVQTGGVYAATYAQIRGARDVFAIPWDFVLFDESAEARNWTDSDQGKAAVMLGHAASKVVYASATPYHTVMELGYMHKLGLWPQGGFTQWAEQFGLREIGPNTFSGGAAAAKLEKLRQQLIERGQWQTLHKDMDGVEAHVAMVPNSEEVKTGVRNIRAAFAMAMKGFQRAGMSRYLTPTAGHEAIYLKRYIESARLPRAIELAQTAIENGWKPVIFSEYRFGSDLGMDFFNHLPGEFGKKVNAMLPPLPDVVAEMRKAFGQKVAIFAGEANQLRAAELEGFMGGDKDAVYMTYSAGAVGANAQDKVGDRPRMGIFLGLPWSGIMFEQGTGRTWRYGTKSNVANVFLTSDALPEMKVLATKILPRMRALKAAVYGERIESKLSRDLRESAGIPEEMLQYEHGEEVKVDAAQFEQTGEGAKYTHIDDLELPNAKTAMNKGMKYKGGGKKLFQGPKDEEPFRRAALDSWNDLLKRTKDAPAPVAHAIEANGGTIRAEAAAAGRQAMGTGEPAGEAVRRKTRDMENDAHLWWEHLKDRATLQGDDLKESSRGAAHFVKSSLWMFGTSGDRAVEKIFRDAKMPEQGAELKRRMIDYDIRSGNYRGEFGGMVAKIIHDNKLKPADHELVTKVVEGQATSDDERINKAAASYRHFFSTVRQRFADAGLVVQFYEEGQKKSIPYSAIASDPKYWPRIYDWNKKFVIRGEGGKREITSLADIMNMPKNSERRERLIEKLADQRGISKTAAAAFFDKNSRGVRLAGNVERAREFDIPMYGRDRRAIDRYVNEVSEKLAAAEVHGQFREKTDPLLDTLPTERDRKLADSIITSDLDPARLHDTDRVALRAVNRWLVLSKMSLSALKLPFHLAKTSMTTNTRSVARAIISGAVHPKDVMNNAVDAGAMVNYMKTAWMREYGMKTGGLDQKMLDFNGFNFLMFGSRAIAAGAGRLWLEKYAYPELAKDPKNPLLRRKLTDLYGYTDEQLDHLAANGYGPQDVKRASLAAANWTTGSGRPSELPAALRGSSGDPLTQRLTTLLRISQSLHGFMFKTANLVNRTVWNEIYHADWKTAEPYHLLGRFAVNFGLAGAALNEILYLRHQMSGSSEADMEKHRREWLEEHPVSKEALFTAMADMSMGMGAEVLTQFFDQLATHDGKDRQKMQQQQRVLNAATDLVLGVAARDVYSAAKGVFDYSNTFGDSGNHRDSPEERRAKILERLANTEVPMSRYAVKPAPPAPRVHHAAHRRRASTVLR